MKNLVALVIAIFADAFNRKHEAARRGAKLAKHSQRFRMESLETRVLLSADLQAVSALIEQPEPATKEQIVQPWEDTPVFATDENNGDTGDDTHGDKGDEGEEEGGDFIEPDAYEELYGPLDYDMFVDKEAANGRLGGQGAAIDSSPGAADVLANNNAGATGTANYTQSETSVIAFGNTVLIAFNDSGSISGGTNKFTGFSRSTDGGVTFTDGGTLPTNPGGDGGDPVLARNDTTGRIYFSTLGLSGDRTIQMFRSDDGGLTWMAPINATPGGSIEDKQWHTVDNFAGPGNGNVYLVSRRFGGPAASAGIYFFRSTD